MHHLRLRFAHFIALIPAAFAVGISLVMVVFCLLDVDVRPVFASPGFANGDIHVNVKDELSQNLVGALVGVGCPGGGTEAIAYTDADGNISAAAGTFVSANCDDGETLTVTVFKPGYITNTSFTATYHTGADNGTYDVTGVKYALKSVGLKSEAGGTIMSLANGSSSADVTLTPSVGVTIYSSVVRDEGLDSHPVIYIAATGSGEGDTVTIQLQNASADGGGADVAQFVKKTIDVSSISGASSQKTIDIENTAEGGDINTTTGFEYPLSVQVADQLGNGINISDLTTPPNLGGFGYYATNGTNKMYFTNVLSHQNLNIVNNGYVNATTTNSGLLVINGGVSTSLDVATHIVMGNAAVNTAGVTAGEGLDAGTSLKGLEFGAVLTGLTDELGNNLIDINPDYALTVRTGDDVGITCSPAGGRWYCAFPASVSGLIQVTKAGFITNTSTSFTMRTSDASPQSQAAVSGVLYGMKITQVRNEANEDVMPDGTDYAPGEGPFWFKAWDSNPRICDSNGLNPGPGSDLCNGTLLQSETYHDFGDGNKAWYLAVTDTDIGAADIVAEIPGYVTRISDGDIYPDPSATSQQLITFTPQEVVTSGTWTEADIQFPLKVHLGDELGNTLSNKNPVMSFDDSAAHYNSSFDSSDFYFAHTAYNGALAVSLDGFVDLNLAVDTGFSHITTDSNTQTMIYLSGTSPRLLPVTAGDTVTGSGLQYGLKVNVVQEGDNAPVNGSIVAVHNSSSDQYPLISEGDPTSYGCFDYGGGSTSYCEARIIDIGGNTNNLRVSNPTYSTKYVPFRNRIVGTDAQHIITAVLSIPRDRDVTVPTVLGHYPEDYSVNSATINPYVTFSKAMDPTTITHTSVRLCENIDCSSIVDADVTLTDGGTRATIIPTTVLQDGTTYWIQVTTSVKDLAGNALATTYGDIGFSQFDIETAPLAVTQVSTVANANGSVGAAIANGSFADGFAWKFNVTAPTDESYVQLKFSDFTSGSHTIAATNIRYCSDQAQTGNTCADDSEGTWKYITAADTYANGIIVFDHDLDPSVAGRQVEFHVEMSVPEATPAGSYSGSYGVFSSVPLG